MARRDDKVGDEKRSCVVGSEFREAIQESLHRLELGMSLQGKELQHVKEAVDKSPTAEDVRNILESQLSKAQFIRRNDMPKVIKENDLVTKPFLDTAIKAAPKRFLVGVSVVVAAFTTIIGGFVGIWVLLGKFTNTPAP